jgi:hypothetical protein
LFSLLRKIVYILKIENPLALADATKEERVSYTKWHDADELAKCYMLAFMTNVLHKQHEDIAIARDVLKNLQ